MSRLIPIAAFAVLTGVAACGQPPDATLFVEDAGQLIENARDAVDAPETAPPGDTSARPSDTGATDTTGPPPDTGVPTDTAPPETGLDPACAEIPTSIVFDGSTPVGLESYERLRIVNCGDLDSESLVISSMSFVNDGVITSSPAFSLDPSVTTPLVVVPFDLAQVDVFFRSDTAGTFTAVLRVVTNDPAHATVDIGISATAN